MFRKPTYKGRPLPRPDEDIEDQGLAFDVGTLYARRGVLSLGGIGLLGLGLAACSTDSTTAATGTTSTSGSASATGTASASTGASETAAESTATGEIPDETAGPYPGDGSNGPDALTASGIVRSDITSSFGDASGTAEGVPMTLTLNIKDMLNDNAAFVGVAVYVWHCDRNGDYSMYTGDAEGENYLRGVQIADENGLVTYTSIFPACYSGRWPHIHFEVYPDQASITDSANAIATSQVALPQDVCEAVYETTGYEASVQNLAGVSLDSDNVFGDDGGKSQLATVTGSVANGYAVSLDVPIDTSTEPTGGSMAGGAGAPPAGGPGGTPPGASGSASGSTSSGS
ncbi:intradiol ring-cleavage dioxygenase [Micrococcales bacterium 31B]|nr:intradiol ring-cleavage dioxygenase [Micrococcales bacterium 31B]